MRFTHVDPFEDTERKKFRSLGKNSLGFTHVDPFEDTESLVPPQMGLDQGLTFHPRRSVRGY